MRRRDITLFAAWAAFLLTLLFPAGFGSRQALSSFGDLYSYHYPLRHLAASALQSGRLPFWNPYIFCGLPLAADSQSVLLYPVSILGDIFPLTLALSWDYAFHWLWGGLGMLLLARRGGLDIAGSLLLASFFCLSPFLVYRIAEGIPTLLASLAWTPWCWLAFGSGRRGLLAAVWSLQFLSGHPQFMLINALGMAVWALAGRAAWRPLLAGGAPVFLLTAAQWVPTREFLGLSVRRDLPAVFSTGYSLGLSTLWTWLDPGALGDPLLKTFGDFPSIFFETCGVFIGVSGLALALGGLVLGKRRAAPVLGNGRGGPIHSRGSGAAAAGALIALGLFLGSGGHNPLYRAALSLGSIGLFRTPARCSFLCLWGLILSAGFLLRRSLVRMPAGYRFLLLLAAAAELAVWDKRFLRAEDDSRYLVVNADFSGRLGGKPVRVMTGPDLASPDKAMLYRAMNVSGYEAYYLRSFLEYAAKSEGRAAADASRTYMTRFYAPGWSRAGVAYYLSSEGWRENPGALPLARLEGAAPLEVTVERPERWRVRGTIPADWRGGTLTLAQPFYPGWKARLNGEPVSIEEWDGFFQEVDVPERWRGQPLALTLDFKPTLWPLLAAATAASWAAWLSLQRREALA